MNTALAIHAPAAGFFYGTSCLTPQAKTVLAHMKRTGSITQREALIDHSVQSLTRRIAELNDHGITINREDKRHPITNQRYARYSIAYPRCVR